MLISLPPENTSGLQNLFDALSVYRQHVQAIFKTSVPVWDSKLKMFKLKWKYFFYSTKHPSNFFYSIFFLQGIS